MPATRLTTLEQDGKAANAAAMRLCAMAAAIFPTDRNLQAAFGDALIPDLLLLALHGRRVMEGYRVVATPIANWGFWPASRVVSSSTSNLHDFFGHVLHATDISLGWEKFDGVIDAYRGRECCFLGHVTLESHSRNETYALGAIAASFLCGVSQSLACQKEGN
ncbi:hypothetical protein [Phaeovulum sp.]|uniref:hypothetical protein n=1 Tax=Phaeovulum sp. TaxID=2934796 RepID=UPI00272F307F|nr:hypothetical protein [Phaeovulum sp.]MDP1667451.1 hypothetical protein [Phaeovulum sp.]MDZ4119968.1 hypothetical protein [Phaeovulum sp.]